MQLRFALMTSENPSWAYLTSCEGRPFGMVYCLPADIQ